ncbi:PH domain-containing protein [uncultured Corynebacterium sp.]|uniref:PH domain-containing protein n=1 Tax=uncultured Corynebacterium sp. TaxID=159447 RepID=UPI0025EBC66D|nr:PH domain-containing protein [uncultured Corynebacterium sp.]
MSRAQHRVSNNTAAVDAEGYRRVHRLTPLMRFWSVILAFLTVFVLNWSGDMFREAYNYVRGGHLTQVGRGSIITLGVFVGVCLVIWYVSAIWWRKLGFKLDDEEISLRHGVISTAFRSARYDRIQAVDVVESVIARIFGLASVRVETAGGVASVIEIRYLRKAEAEALRREVLAHVHGAAPRVQPGVADARSAADGAGTAADGTVHAADAASVAPLVEDPRAAGTPFIDEIPIGRTLAAEALRLSTGVIVVILLLLWFTPVPKSSVIPIIVGFVPSIWGLIDTSWRFNARLDEERGVLNISYGLADRRQQAIRLNRIHGVRVTQPFLWRLCGWYEVQVSVAGYGAKGGGKQSGSTRILPVGTREQALQLFALVSPLSREEIEEYARPEGHTHPTFTSPGRAFIASPVDLRQQSVTLLNDVAITHAGRIARRVMAVGTPHIQELTYHTGPISQLLRVGTLRFEMVDGPVKMAGCDLDPADAAELMEQLRRRRLPALDAAPVVEPDDSSETGLTDSSEPGLTDSPEPGTAP